MKDEHECAPNLTTEPWFDGEAPGCTGVWMRGVACDTDDALSARCAARARGPCRCVACTDVDALLAPDLGGEG